MADIYRIVKDADGRVLPAGFAVKDDADPDPQFLIDLQAATAGSVLQSLTPEQGATLEEGLHVAADGTVGPPPTETNAERRDRLDEVREHILLTVGSRGFAAYRALSPEHARRAFIYEATRRAMFFRALQPSVLTTDAQWGVLAAMIAPAWRDVAAALDLTSWDNGNDLALVLLLRDGAAWRTPTLNATSMLYEATQEGGAAQWPTGFTVGAEVQAEYERVLASV